jgi:hypothetical protein
VDSRESAEPEVAVGCRVVLSSSGLFGTVRFVGAASFQEGLWVGVELDSEQVRENACVLLEFGECGGLARCASVKLMNNNSPFRQLTLSYIILYSFPR